MLLKRLITFLKAIQYKNSMRKTVLDKNSQFSVRFFRKHSATYAKKLGQKMVNFCPKRFFSCYSYSEWPLIFFIFVNFSFL